ncbi:MAG: hypothetical protein AAGI69_28240 [Cyanobacteria bacterium P01_H01_bin.21]
MASLKASPQGLRQIKQARADRGWTINDGRWLMAASQILDPDGDWQESGPYAYGCSFSSWERFLSGISIREDSFIAFCQVLGVDPETVAES